MPPIDKKSDKKTDKKTDKKNKRIRKPKVCQFCARRIEYIDYKDLATLKPYLNERGKIKARRTTGTCVQHQSRMAMAIKNAREMALIPFVVR